MPSIFPIRLIQTVRMASLLPRRNFNPPQSTAIRHISKSCTLKNEMEVKFKDTHIEFNVQHLDYGSIIGGRQINPTCLLKLGEIASHAYSVVKRNIAKEADEKFADLFYVKWQQYDIQPDFYDRPINTLQPLSYLNCLGKKMRICLHFLPITETSQSLVFSGFDGEFNALLFVATVVLVNVDPNTNKPSPFPTSLRNHFTPDLCTSPAWYKARSQPKCQKLINFQPMGGLYYKRCCSVNIRQVGVVNYTTQSALVEICLEGLGEALSKSTFGNIGTIFERQVCRVSALYLGLSSLGDVLETTIWQDKVNSAVFKFHIKKGSSIVCQAEIELDPPSDQ